MVEGDRDDPRPFCVRDQLLVKLLCQLQFAADLRYRDRRCSMRKSWVRITARNISIVVLGLGCLIPLASALADQTKRTISVLALDGVSWTANVFTDSPVYDFADRDLPYLEPAFRGAWGDFARIQSIQ